MASVDADLLIGIRRPDGQPVVDLLSQSQAEIDSFKAKHTAITQELEEFRVQNKTMEEKLAAGERDLNDQIDKNMSLLNQLGDVDSAGAHGLDKPEGTSV